MSDSIEIAPIAAEAVARYQFHGQDVGRLLDQRAEAGAGYDLSEAEMGALHHLPPENFDAVAALLAARHAPAPPEPNAEAA